jgi:uncharacterized membrane protein (UPF0182 family)
LWHKFLFGWKFDGTRFFLSSYPEADSRIMFHRRIHERVSTLAPFLELDRDPYVVLSEGRLYWIVDAYTKSENYPYSEPFSTRSVATGLDRSAAAYAGVVGSTVPNLEDANYVRNAVKVVVDAFNGSVDFYVFAENDPLIRVWQRVFPDLFRPREDMPESLEAHIRYPIDFLLAQGIVYGKYHMTDPAVFYNQEDLWIRATEKYYSQVEPVDPYYIMWEQPGLDQAELVLMMPFTPKNRQVVIGWIAGLCHPNQYGELIAYKFPKEKRVLGPQQVETKIDQDRFLSGQLTLWDQRGSNVIRGNVLAIPIDDTLLYVEPIYLQAETAAYPELRLVALMHGDRLSYAESFDEALQGLFEPGGTQQEPGLRVETGPGRAREIGRQAKEAFENYLRLLSERRFEDAAGELERLEELLNRLAAAEEKPTTDS